MREKFLCYVRAVVNCCLYRRRSNPCINARARRARAPLLCFCKTQATKEKVLPPRFFRYCPTTPRFFRYCSTMPGVSRFSFLNPSIFYLELLNIFFFLKHTLSLRTPPVLQAPARSSNSCFVPSPAIFKLPLHPRPPPLRSRPLASCGRGGIPATSPPPNPSILSSVVPHRQPKSLTSTLGAVVTASANPSPDVVATPQPPLTNNLNL
jgi:hypothetical protein